MTENLRHYQHRDDVTVLGLPRGGIPLAASIARDLDAPLGVLVVEKIRTGNTIRGAITGGNLEVSPWAPSGGFQANSATILRAEAQARESLARRVGFYAERAGDPPIENRQVLIVDDGIASGLTMLAAARSARAQGASRIVLAAPVAARKALEMLESECDEIVCLATPVPFNSIAECYLDFATLSDEDCTDILTFVVKEQISNE